MLDRLAAVRARKNVVEMFKSEREANRPVSEGFPSGYNAFDRIFDNPRFFQPQEPVSLRDLSYQSFNKSCQLL